MWARPLGGIIDRLGAHLRAEHGAQSARGCTTRHPEAKKLLGEYMTQMPNQQLTPRDARAIVEYLRTQGARVLIVRPTLTHQGAPPMSTRHRSRRVMLPLIAGAAAAAVVVASCGRSPSTARPPAPRATRREGLRRARPVRRVLRLPLGRLQRQRAGVRRCPRAACCATSPSSRSTRRRAGATARRPSRCSRRATASCRGMTRITPSCRRPTACRTAAGSSSTPTTRRASRAST